MMMIEKHNYDNNIELMMISDIDDGDNGNYMMIMILMIIKRI